MSFVRSLSLGFQFIWGTINRSSELLETLMSEDFGSRFGVGRLVSQTTIAVASVVGT